MHCITLSWTKPGSFLLCWAKKSISFFLLFFCNLFAIQNRQRACTQVDHQVKSTVDQNKTIPNCYMTHEVPHQRDLMIPVSVQPSISRWTEHIDLIHGTSFQSEPSIFLPFKKIEFVCKDKLSRSTQNHRDVLRIDMANSHCFSFVNSKAQNCI